MKKYLSILLTLLLVGVCTGPTIANEVAQQTTTFYQRCKLASEFNCIESISAELPDGKKIAAIDTGEVRNSPLSIDDPYLKNISGPRSEWRFPGLRFETGNETAVFSAWYWPAEYQHCWVGGFCKNSEEEVDIYVHSSRNPAFPSASDATASLDAVFTVRVRVAKDYTPIVTYGVAKNGSMKKVLSGSNFNTFDASFSQIQLTSEGWQSVEGAFWAYGTRNGHVEPVGPCRLSGGLVLMTNAYLMNEPVWNNQTQSIEVKLTGAHLKPNGDLNQGYLEVRIPVAMGKCMWGVDLRQKVQAQVSLSYDGSGTRTNATVTGTLQGSDYVMLAAGFHYSSPKVSIALKQGNAIVTKKQVTVTCVKGKLTKKVTAVAPKCPAGYKKKA